MRSLIVPSCLLASAAASWGQSAVWLPQNATSGNIYYNGGAVGIGTTNPSSLVIGTEKLGVVGLISSKVTGSDPGFATWTNSGGTGPSPIFTAYSTSSGVLSMQYSYDGTNLVQNTNAAAQVWSFGAVEKMRLTNGGNVGIGTTNPCGNAYAPANCKLSVAGAIQAQEVVVNTGWSDYVFAPGYRLQPLKEVGAYIAENHHLPDIPSEAEVKAKGVGVGEMESKLLAKVEELTLHLIQAEERTRELQERIARLEKHQ